MPDTATLTIHAAGQTRRLSVEPTRGSTVLTSLLRAADLPLNTRCGQRGLCDGCLVDLLSGSLVDIATAQPLTAADVPQVVRACQYRLAAGGTAEVRVPGRSLLAHEPQVVTSFSVNVSRAFDPLWQRVELARDELATGEPFVQAVCQILAQRRDGDVPVLASSAVEALEPAADAAMALILEHRGDHWLAQPDNGQRAVTPYGLAIDIGTTTVVVLLVDLSNGEIVASASALNAQTRLGDNVLTRIQLCLNNPAMISRLQKAVASKTIGSLVRQLLNEHALAVEQLVSIAVAGNTTMLHLLAGVDPGSMGTAPFTAQFLEHRVLAGCDVPLRLQQRTDRSDGPAENAGPPQAQTLAEPRLHLLPGAAAYVGADIMAGVLSSGMVYSPDTCLLVDVGTNGEIVLGHDRQLLACATAAGPAFEGAGLNCGMRAGRGAISHIRLDDTAAGVHWEVIGDTAPIGLCGTAYVDFVAQARRIGLLTPTGRFTARAIAEHPCISEGKHSRRFRLTTGPDGEPIEITELDIASLLQAKAAIAAGIVCLLQRVGLTSGDVQTVYLAGGFGFHMDIPNVIRCGLLPGFCPEQIRLVGNTSLAGAYLALVDSSALDEIKAISRRVEVVELNLEPGFESCYIDQLSIPG
jgi:uncharacterized 2Fe-2S/4Fe-4S cluster protein (DUF4445 family)